MNYSRQRESICDIVKASRSHPTADEVYNMLKPSQPKLSLATVYRNLNQLYNSGEIRRLSIGDQPCRFDGDLKKHDHLYCKKCKRLFDIPSATSRIPKHINGHTIESREIIYFGVCSECEKE